GLDLVVDFGAEGVRGLGGQLRNVLALHIRVVSEEGAHFDGIGTDEIRLLGQADRVEAGEGRQRQGRTSGGDVNPGDLERAQAGGVDGEGERLGGRERPVFEEQRLLAGPVRRQGAVALCSADVIGHGYRGRVAGDLGFVDTATVAV